MTEVTPAIEEFSDFFRREYPRLARACLLLTSDRVEAEELAQEALARAYTRWTTHVAVMESPAGYVYRTALNLNRKRLRRLAVRARHVMSPQPQPNIDDVADNVDILRAVRELPRGQREALVMVEWLDVDIQEAASLLGIAPASVRGRLFRARRALRERFGGTDA